MDYSVPRFPATAAAKSLQSCPTLCDHIDGSPTRLPSPCDSPGKNTEVGCHFHLQCMKVKRESEVVQLCPTPSDPMDCSLPGSSVHGIFQARVLEWGAIAFSCHSMRIYIWKFLEGRPEKAMALHSSTLAWKIPWMEMPGRLQSMGSRRV